MISNSWYALHRSRKNSTRLKGKDRLAILGSDANALYMSITVLWHYDFALIIRWYTNFKYSNNDFKILLYIMRKISVDKQIRSSTQSFKWEMNAGIKGESGASLPEGKLMPVLYDSGKFLCF